MMMIEADGDVSEAIDFCRFYAVEMRQLGTPVVTQAVPGERCVQTWTPRGVGVESRLFDRTPLALVTRVVTEEASLTAAGVRQRLARRPVAAWWRMLSA